MVTAGFLLVLVTSFLIVAWKTSGPVRNTDTFFHLRLGAEFLDGWSLRHPASVTDYATSEWSPTQLLGQLSLAGVEQWGGLPAVALLTAVAALAHTTVLFITARAWAPLSVTAFIVLVALLATSPGLSGRPQVVSYMLTALVTSGWLRAWHTGRTPWWIIGVCWFWSLVHGMWPVGIAVSVLAVVGLALDGRLRGTSLRRSVAVPALSAVAVLLTPLWTDAYASVLRVGAISEHFAEWQPPSFTEGSTLTCAALALATIVVALRRGPWEWTPLLLTLLAVGWLVYTARTVPVAAAMLTPLAAQQLAHLVPRTRPGKLEVIGTGLALLVCLGLATFRADQATDVRADSPAHASVAQLPAGMGLLNEWGEGGYDMWRHRSLQVVAHGYGDMFTDEELERNVQLADLDPGWYEQVVALDLDDALLYSDGRLAHALKDKGWTVVAEDPAPKADDRAPKPLVHLRAPAERG